MTRTSECRVNNTQLYKKQDDIRRETVKKLIHPFSEKSKESIRCMGDTEYFEMCEITSKDQCQDCLLYWEIGIVYCTCGTCLRPSQMHRKLDNDRYDVLSIPNYVMKKGPSHEARHGTTERQRIYFKAHIALRKAKKHGHKTIS